MGTRKVLTQGVSRGLLTCIAWGDARGVPTNAAKREAPMPRWVKVFGIIALLLALLAVVVLAPTLDDQT
jgi:hypothetical protein